MNRTAITISLAAIVALAVLAGVILQSEPQDEPVDRILANPGLTYDPVAAGEDMPLGYRQLLDRDQIAPIYNPAFTTRTGVDWPAAMLVIGVSGEDTAKAYPVTPLNQREMVIDSLNGIPILVTW